MSRFLKQTYQELEAYVPGEQPRDMVYIKLNTNESPFPPAPQVAEAMTKEQVDLLRLYSDPTCKVLKEKLANLYGVKTENIYVGNGSDEVLEFAFMAFAQDGVLFPDITYGFYTVFGDLFRADYRQVPLKEDFSVDYKDYCNAGKMIVIANPNAPTGLSIPVWQIEEILKSNPDHVVLIDEAYVDFGGESCYPLLNRYENLLVVRTFSKSRCLAGGRLGYAIGPANLIADLEKLKFSTNPFNVNRLSMVLGEATVDAEDYYQEKCREIIAIREKSTELMREMDFEVLPSQGNFIFARHNAIGGEALYLELKKRGILVRHFNGARIREFNRITIGTAEQMDKFIATVREIMAGRSL